MEHLTSLFLAQSYSDAWETYKRSLKASNAVYWDYVILTASNELQAEGYRSQLKAREDSGFLPKHTHFAVIPDPDGKRVGSGGATLSVIRYIAEHSGNVDFSGLRILVIHSGGDSKRVPQYSALGKLFSPVPNCLPNQMASTLFDEFMMVMSSVPGRIREGMLLASGDVLLLFNPLQIDYSGVGACAISFKEPVETGKNHGVFVQGENGNVSAFLHKQSVEDLTKKNAVNEKGCVDIDTGAVVFSAEMLSSLYSLICTNGIFDTDKFNQFVNEKVRLSLYGDFLYPLAETSTLDAFYKEKPEGEFCDELKTAREQVWSVLRPYRMKLLRFAPAKFIHFGTTSEILRLMSSEIDKYDNLGWSRQVNSSIPLSAAGYTSIVSDQANVGKDCYFELSHIHSGVTVGDNVLLSHIEVKEGNIPSNVVLHGLKQRDGKFVARIYGVSDNPKLSLEDNASLCGVHLADFLEKLNLSQKDLWDSNDHTLWNAKLYPVCDTMEEAVSHALNLYNLCYGAGDFTLWKNTERKSLSAGFFDADANAIIAWNNRMRELMVMEGIAKAIADGVSADEVCQAYRFQHLTKMQEDWLKNYFKTADFSAKIRLYYYIGKILGETYGDEYFSKCFGCIRDTILQNSMDTTTYHSECRIQMDTHTVSLPLRVNFGGGWSDTPPYCIEQGGTVFNAAILLNGKKPVEVTLKRIPEYKIVLESRDMDVHGEFTSLDPLLETGNPYDPFALQKAALLACGILPKEGGNLTDILKRAGGGFVMDSEVTGVPKGSGLGTSSILSAACVKAIYEFFGISYDDAKLYQSVLCVEQIMSTGGGWQDQVGGVTDGLKYITTKPGLLQDIQVEYVPLKPDILAKLNQRFALIYTGQRRLARNLLREVVGRYIGNIPEVVFSLSEIQLVSQKMKDTLLLGDIDAFANLMNEHWNLSKQIDSGITNILIDQIFLSVDDLIDAKLVCGAGGGGFLQVILKEGVTREQVRDRLKSVFGDSGIDVWDCTII
ncbi:MAG: bifunctional fucokinase/L-fucose-1-P-guanylyltransferase [Ruminococcaceae bacterium]|nr:bifunctional fucokinase/L-fucose-1-P-guanylyltransferase [Oscillospiraceae bacterium]